MNNNKQETIRSMNLVLIANLISIFISGAITLMVPKVLDASHYGYWQLYLLYSVYVGFFHFGLQDGIYLRYGGLHYNSLDKKKMHSQFIFLLILILVEAIFILVIAANSPDINKKVIFIYFTIMMLLYLPNAHLLYILQMTMRMQEYSISLILEKIFFLIFSLSILFWLQASYKLFVLADIFGKFISLLYSSYACRDILFCKGCGIFETLREAYKNICAGIKLLFANIAGMFITGIPRYSVEKNWDISTFGKVSLVFSLCNFFIIFVTAIGQVLFPILKRTDDKYLSDIYSTINTLTTYMLIILVAIYQPVKALLNIWLPQYNEAFLFFAILLPMCIFEAKISMILSTYYKALRMENKLFICNLIAVMLSACYTFVTIQFLNSLFMVILGVTIVSGMRCIILEINLANYFSTDCCKRVLTELLIVAFFVLVNYKIQSGVMAFFSYLGGILIYSFIHRMELSQAINNTHKLLNNNKMKGQKK